LAAHIDRSVIKLREQEAVEARGRAAGEKVPRPQSDSLGAALDNRLARKKAEEEAEAMARNEYAHRRAVRAGLSEPVPSRIVIKDMPDELSAVEF
jgi:hypothetical protein